MWMLSFIWNKSKSLGIDRSDEQLRFLITRWRHWSKKKTTTDGTSLVKLLRISSSQHFPLHLHTNWCTTQKCRLICPNMGHVTTTPKHAFAVLPNFALCLSLRIIKCRTEIKNISFWSIAMLDFSQTDLKLLITAYVYICTQKNLFFQLGVL